MLVVFGGLPATGKTSLARALAAHLEATYVRVDAVEAALVRAGLVAGRQAVGAAGYLVAAAFADTSLENGATVVVDAVNAVEVSRATWRRLAERREVTLLFVEVICSDVTAHRERVALRVSDVAGSTAPTWDQIMARDYEPWSEPHLVIDNVGPLQRHVKRIVNAMHSEPGD